MVFPEEPHSWPVNMELITARRFLPFIKRAIMGRSLEKASQT